MKRILMASLVVLMAATSASGAQVSGPQRRWCPWQAMKNSFLFHPQADRQSWLPLPTHVAFEEVWLPAGNGERFHAWWLPHPESDGAVLFCHGNAGNLSHFSPRAVTLQRALQKSVLIFDYPGYGKSTGKPSESGCYAAAEAAEDWLIRIKQIPASKLILVGESLGGGVATHLALRSRHRALVLVRTFTSIADMARNRVLTMSSASLVRKTFDNLDRIPRCQAPIFIAHGDRDRLIPLTQAQQLYQAAGEPKRFFVLKDCGHNDPWPQEFLGELADFLQRGKN